MSLYYMGFLVIASIGLIGYALWPKEGDQEDATIKRRMTGKRSNSVVSDVRKKAKESVAKKMVDAVAPIAIRPSMVSSAEDMSKLRTWADGRARQATSVQAAVEVAGTERKLEI